uniref:Myocardial zonula adherens protein n=1 Tax=Astyanax mexicanus TaxID=7994 RepID=A0A8B9HE54_ASTMX
LHIVTGYFMNDKREQKTMNGSWKKKNGLMQRERPPGRESPVEDKHSCGVVSNGVGPRVFGVVQRTGEQQQQEVTAREWPVNTLRDEMRYIREVRDSLEKVRERMYGQFGGMQQSMQKLSQELRMANSQKRYLEAEVKTGRAAMDSFDQMNSSLISANIDLQKALLDTCNGRVGNREEMKALRSSFEKTEERLRERERQLAAAQAENQALKLQVESSQEASARAVKEMSAKLQQQYEQQLQEQEKKHRQEIQALQAQLEEYMRRLEEAERNVKLAEEKIAERDQRISEVERLMNCMAQEKSQLTQQLCECEKRLRSLNGEDQVDSGAPKQLQLQREALELKERIKHLNDMVFCQQRKVKSMIEEVKLYFLINTLNILNCFHCLHSHFYIRIEFSGSRPAPSAPRPPSRLDYSLLRYTPLQYSSMLTGPYTRDTATSPTENTTHSDSARPSDEGVTLLSSSSSSSSSSPDRATSNPSKIYTPFMRLMEITAKLNVE